MILYGMDQVAPRITRREQLTSAPAFGQRRSTQRCQLRNQTCGPAMSTHLLLMRMS